MVLVAIRFYRLRGQAVNNNEAIDQLALRMNVDGSLAAEWLRAVLDVLSGSFEPSAFGDILRDHGRDDDVDTDVAPVLRPVTAESWEALRSKELEMRHFPFRFGREGRIGTASPSRSGDDRRAACTAPSNDHYLLDRGTPLNISREHFQIERVGRGRFDLVDRGSACGTIVSGNIVGGEYTSERIPLEDGDTIIVGTPQSPYVFSFHLGAER